NPGVSQQIFLGHQKMVHFDSSFTPSTYLSEEKRSVSVFSYPWFIIELVVMVVTTTVIIAVFMRKEQLSEFFMEHIYLEYIILSVGFLLFFLCVFVRQIRSKSLSVCIVLEIAVILWSVCLASVLPSFDITCVLVSLALTVMITILTVVLASELPPLNLKGVIFFASASVI
ncbi:unnamed protein product, partial [Trichobilharzia szidati]